MKLFAVAFILLCNIITTKIASTVDHWQNRRWDIKGKGVVIVNRPEADVILSDNPGLCSHDIRHIQRMYGFVIQKKRTNLELTSRGSMPGARYQLNPRGMLSKNSRLSDLANK